MLAILRQLTPDEMRQVLLLCSAGYTTSASAAPEEIIRALSRLCGATTWLIFPAASAEALLDQAGRRMGLPPLTAGPRAVTQRERAILATYVRYAWDAAGSAVRQEVLTQVRLAWDHPALPMPETPTEARDEPALRLTFEGLLRHSAGCRALAVALEKAPLPLPAPFAGGFGGTVRFGAVTRAGAGHEALYGVLVVLWRARARLLRERREQRAHLERQMGQAESLLAVRRRNWGTQPVQWTLNPESGLSVTFGAVAAVGLQTLIATASEPALILALVTGAAGAAWSLTAFALRPGPGSDHRLLRVDAQLDSLRRLYAQVQLEIRALESE